MSTLLSHRPTLKHVPRDPQYDPMGAAQAALVQADVDANAAIVVHSSALDPHGDRAFASQSFVPLSWFDANGVLSTSRLPALAVTDTFPVNDQAGMLALGAERGDLAIRADDGGVYLLMSDNPSQLSAWRMISSVSAVTSVNSRTGAVVLTAADVGAAALSHAAAHSPGGADDISAVYVPRSIIGQTGGVASFSDSRITGAQQTSGKSISTAKVANGYIGADSSGNVSPAQLYVASSSTAGVVQLGGDLGGTWNSVVVLNKMPLVTPNPTIYTAVTNPHTPVQGEVAQYNANGGSIAQTLPAAPTGTGLTILELKNLTPTTSTNTVTFSAAGTDTIDYVSNNPLVLRIYGEGRRLIGYQGNWTIDVGLNPLSGLDTRYLQIANAHQVPAGGTTGQALVKTGSADYAIGWGTVASGSSSPIENVNVVSSSATAQAIPDVTTATINDITLTANCTFTFPAAAAGKSFTLILRQDATGGRTITWPAVLWPSGAFPVRSTGANAVDMFTFISVLSGGSYVWSGSMGAKDIR